MSAFSRSDRLVTGFSATSASVLGVVLVALYFVYSGPPPASNVIGRNLITIAMLVGFMIFALGLHRLLRARRGGDAGLAGTLAVTSLLVYAAVTFVATSLEVGTSLQFPDGSVDPTLDGPLAAGMVLLHGPIARVLVATYLITLTVAANQAQVFSRGVLVGNVVVAAINLVLIPSIFFGMNAAFVYAANGWGSVAAIGLVNILWFAVLDGAVLAHRSTAPAVDLPSRPEPGVAAAAGRA